MPSLIGASTAILFQYCNVFTKNEKCGTLCNEKIATENMNLPLELGKNNTILRQMAEKVDFSDTALDLRKLSLDMIDTMKKEKGVGLAGPQIGKLKRIIVISPEKNPEVLINPKITYFSKDTDIQTEGCLSLPGIEVSVERSKKIRYSYRDLDGKKVKGKAKGLKARVIQHEVDHLNGVLIVDKPYEK